MPAMPELRRAAFVAVGSELLRAERVDTNSFLAARLLAPCGFVFVEKRVVEDDEAAIAAAVMELGPRVDLVLVSGGLGPTADDVTRQGVARALGRGLARDAGLLAGLERRYAAFGRPMPAIAARMADVVEGAEVLRNAHGTAPGLLLAGGGGRAAVVLLPGVPSELEEILAVHVVPRWEASRARATRVLHLGGVYESHVEDRVGHLYDRFGRESVTILAGRGVVDLILAADAPARLEEMETAFLEVVGADVFGRDAETLAGVVLDRLRQRGWRLATAESCTGGLIGGRLTAVPGASQIVVGGVVAYSDRLKAELLGVDPGTLASRGAVSEEVARAMARGAQALGAECGLSVTGIAGPGGGSAAKPVGLVHMAVATPEGERHLEWRFPGSREQVRELAANFTLDLLRRALEPS